MKCTPDNIQCPLHKELIASDARYQLRIKELEEALRQMVNYATANKCGLKIADDALSATTPDTALQRIVLEARIDEHNYIVASDDRLGKLRAQLVALGE